MVAAWRGKAWRGKVWRGEMWRGKGSEAWRGGARRAVQPAALVAVGVEQHIPANSAAVAAASLLETRFLEGSPTSAVLASAVAASASESTTESTVASATSRVPLTGSGVVVDDTRLGPSCMLASVLRRPLPASDEGPDEGSSEVAGLDEGVVSFCLSRRGEGKGGSTMVMVGRG